MYSAVNCKKPESPCHGCGKRTVGCHSGCTEYTEYRKVFDEKAAEKERQRVAIDSRAAAIESFARRNRCNIRAGKTQIYRGQR